MRRPSWRGIEWLSILNVVIAMIATYVAVRALQTTRETMMLDERAWVGLSKTDSFTLAADAPIQAQFVLANSGKSPALKITHLVRSRVLDAGQQFTPDYLPQAEQSAYVLQPGATMAVGIQSPAAVPKDSINGVTTGKLVLYIYGRIWYRDIFDRQHESTFCSMMKPRNGVPALVACPFYNTAN